jgi:ABC-type transport system involved in multi-copper enzyme maturation permease subunit
VTAATFSFVLRSVSLSWLTGPIFDKELRVSSRRRTSYVLRSVYILVLSIFVLYTWFITVNLSGAGAAFQVSRMAIVGKGVTTTIVWFQFIVAQLITIVMLSTSVSSEIRQRTLGVLMTTPMNSLQIVMGKLLSGLLQTGVLLGISLPLLAIVRVMGGVPWDYVVSSLCITLTATIFAGSLSLLMSIRSRHSYTVVLTIIAGYSIAFGFLPAMMAAFSSGRGFFENLLHLANPFFAMGVNTSTMLLPPGLGGGLSSWLLHCAIMLAAAGCVVFLAVLRVRHVALAQASGGKEQSRPVGKAKTLSRRRSRSKGLPIRRVQGAPVFWMEMSGPFGLRGRGDTILYVMLGVIIIISCSPMLFIGAFAWRAGLPILGNILALFLLIVIVRLAVLSAASITREKEARTWPILLATPLDDRDILFGKGYAALHRNLRLMAVLVVLWAVGWLLCAFTELSMAEATLYLIEGAAVLAGTVICIIGLGLYFGVRLKSTSSAVAATIGAYVGLGCIGCGILSSVIMRPFTFVQGGPEQVLFRVVWVMLIGVGHAIIGMIAYSFAKQRLRYKVFG